MSVRKCAVVTGLAGAGIAMLALFAAIGAPGAAAQVRPYTPPQTAAPGADWTERIEGLLPPGVESRAEATKRIASYKPDPVKHPVPRTAWDGKPDFSGVYWPDATFAPPPVPLESLYRPDAQAYREGGGAARGLIDWRGIDTPNYHCWPPSPVNGSMGGTVQLVSAPGFLLMLNEGLGRLPDHSHRWRERASTARAAQAVLSRLVGRSLGRRHTGCRGDELQRQAMAWTRPPAEPVAADLVRFATPRGALEPARRAGV